MTALKVLSKTVVKLRGPGNRNITKLSIKFIDKTVERTSILVVSNCAVYNSAVSNRAMCVRNRAVANRAVSNCSVYKRDTPDSY
ncbi:hypothetical protein X777_10425, partial [Ooceraea biroi]